MSYTTLVTPDVLHAHLREADWAIFDCRFSLSDTERGRQAYREAHIPGAIYAHLDEDLSGEIIPGTTGRHPLPEPAAFAERLSGWGIDANVQVVAYDDFGGGIAARLWWMLRWLGHEAVAVLDGGFPAWQRLGYPTTSGEELRPLRSFRALTRTEMIAEADELVRRHGDPDFRLLDARAAERYRGEHEPIDPVAGHIPDAVSVPFTDNLDAEGSFRSSEELRARFEQAFGGVMPEQVINYCGSGVTAAHNLLAQIHAGLAGARLYPGSWSHWITDAERPVE